MALDVKELTDEYFIENRNRILEIAAFLDRLDRADPARHGRDFRLEAFADALKILAGGRPDYLAQIQQLFSDPTTEPIGALDRKSAQGAWEARSQKPSLDDARDALSDSRRAEARSQDPAP